MPKIFICYRREETEYQADRLHAALKRADRKSKHDIFIDIDNIPAGVDFTKHIDDQVAQCDLLLALIGPSWLRVGEGFLQSRRLDDPKDFVRIEIASALKREIPVVPILLDGASMPKENELPDELKPFARRNAVEVRRKTFDHDVTRLIESFRTLEQINAQARASTPRSRKFGIGTALGTVTLLVTGAALFALIDPLHWRGTAPRTPSNQTELPIQTNASAAPGPALTTTPTKPAETSAPAAKSNGPEILPKDLSPYGADVAGFAKRKDWKGVNKNALGFWNGTGGRQLDPTAARTLFNASCEGGDLEGCNYLGVMYDLRTSNWFDPDAAKKHYDIACKGGLQVACTNLGIVYRDGIGVGKDPKLALQLFQTSCTAKEGSGCLNAGIMFGAGIDFPKDDAKASEYFALACDSGVAPAGCTYLGQDYLLGNGTAKDPIKAVELLRKACDANDPPGCTALGASYKFGTGVAIDLDAAFKLFEKACGGNDPWGCNYLGQAFGMAQGVAQDQRRAKELLDKSCALKTANACTNLGVMFEEAMGIPVDFERARQLYETGCGGNDALGCFRLGALYGNGRGVALNRDKAIELYKKALSIAPNLEAARTNLRILGVAP